MELNKLYNMDCLEYMSRLEDNCVDLVLTDIPYDECSDREEGGLRHINKDTADVLTFPLGKFMDEVIRICKGSIYIFCGTEQVSTLRKAGVDKGLSTRLCIWEKTNPSPMNGQHLWLSSVECCVFMRKSNATFNEFCQSPVWRHPCGSSKRHPTEKPLDLFRRLIRASSNHGDIVFDPCIGSGTTAEAAVLEGRKFIGTELCKEYYDVANKRLRHLTGPFYLFGNIGV